MPQQQAAGGIVRECHGGGSGDGKRWWRWRAQPRWDRVVSYLGRPQTAPDALPRKPCGVLQGDLANQDANAEP